MIEIDQIAVVTKIWEQVKAGDRKALLKLRDAIDGLELYLHAFPLNEDETLVTLRELKDHHVVDRVKVMNEKWPA